MDTPTITIDFDQKCKRCGKLGAVENGVCLACLKDGITKMQRRNNMKFGPKSIETLCEIIKGALETYMDSIDASYLKTEGALTINLPVKIMGSAKGGLDFDIKISFVSDKIEDHFKGSCQEDQMELFGGENA